MKKIKLCEQNIQKIQEEVKKYVYGQDEAIAQVLGVILSHFEKLKMVDMGIIESFKKEPALLIGPSGSGKTYLLEMICQIVDLPICIIDGSRLTSTGWRGDNLEDWLYSHFKNVGRSSNLFEHSIVVIDEIDKKSNYYYQYERNYEAKDQASILKMIESGSILAKDNENSSEVILDTSKILFIFAGAFTSFANKTKISILDNQETSYKCIKKTDLIEYGFMREFVSRLGEIVYINPLTEKNYRDILMNSKNSVLHEWTNLLLNQFGIQLKIDNEVINNIITEARKDGLGVRAMNSRFSEIFTKRLLWILENKTETIHVKLNERKEIEVVKEGNYVTLSKQVETMINKNHPKHEFHFSKHEKKAMQQMKQIISIMINNSFTHIRYTSRQEVSATENLLWVCLLYLYSQCNQDDQHTVSVEKLINCGIGDGKTTLDFILEDVGKIRYETNYKDMMIQKYRIFKKYTNNYSFDFEGLKLTVLNFAAIKNKKERGGKSHEY